MKNILFTLLSFSFGILAQSFDKAIEDNSVLIEEAYNQEERIVQHIFSVERINEESYPLNISFTQEWPLGGQHHQLSYTLPFANNEAIGSTIGDIMINYRFQWLDGNEFVAVAPRASLILPTGKPENGMGNNKFGLELNIPISKRLANSFVTHYNAGMKFIPHAEHSGITINYEKTINDFFFGASCIWLVNYNFNLMLEFRLDNFSSREQLSNERTTSNILNAAIRYAIDFDNLQILPILAIPTYFEEGKATSNILFYISFEHNF